MAFPADSVSLLVGLVLLGVTGTLGFLVRHAFQSLTEGLKELRIEVAAKLDTLAVSLHTNYAETQVLAQRIATVERELKDLKERLHEIELSGCARRCEVD